MFYSLRTTAVCQRLNVLFIKEPHTFYSFIVTSCFSVSVKHVGLVPLFTHRIAAINSRFLISFSLFSPSLEPNTKYTACFEKHCYRDARDSLYTCLKTTGHRRLYHVKLHTFLIHLCECSIQSLVYIVTIEIIPYRVVHYYKHVIGLALSFVSAVVEVILFYHNNFIRSAVCDISFLRSFEHNVH